MRVFITLRELFVANKLFQLRVEVLILKVKIQNFHFLRFAKSFVFMLNAIEGFKF